MQCCWNSPLEVAAAVHVTFEGLFCTTHFLFDQIWNEYTFVGAVLSLVVPLLDQSDVFLFLYFKPFLSQSPAVRQAILLSDVSSFNVDVLRVFWKMFVSKLLLFFHTINQFHQWKQRLVTFTSFISPKKLLSVHLSTLCNEPEHVKDLLKNPENLQPRSDCLLRRPG